MRRHWLPILALAQCVLLGLILSRRLHPSVDPKSATIYAPPYTVGDTLQETYAVLVSDSAVFGHRSAELVPASGVTLLLLAGESCPYCELAIPGWQQLAGAEDSLANTGVNLRIVSVDPATSAKAWAAAKGLTLPLFSMPRGESTVGPAFRLGHRLPWAYLIDNANAVVAERHGAEAAILLAEYASRTILSPTQGSSPND